MRKNGDSVQLCVQELVDYLWHDGEGKTDLTVKQWEGRKDSMTQADL